jgi:hypothetical protein
MTGTSHRPFTALVALLVLPLFLGALIAPWVLRVTQHIPAFAEDGLERVASRCVQVVALLLLWPALRWSGLTGEIGDALRPNAARWRDLRQSILAGCVTMLALYTVGWGLGAYVPDRVNQGPVGVLTEALLFLPGAALVGVLEEAFFRGFVFGALRARLRPVTATLLASAFFSMIHFARPQMPDRFVTGGPWDGFLLVPHLFARFHFYKDWPFAATLLAMGLTLCVLYQRRGNLYLCIGLHAGWVWAMRVGELMLDRAPGTWAFWFGRGDLVGRSPVAMVFILVFLAAAFFVRPARPAA